MRESWAEIVRLVSRCIKFPSSRGKTKQAIKKFKLCYQSQIIEQKDSLETRAVFPFLWLWWYTS